MKRAIITGATGCIGMALIEQCVKNDIEVTVLAHKGSPRNQQIPRGEMVRLVEWDLLEDLSKSCTTKAGEPNSKNEIRPSSGAKGEILSQNEDNPFSETYDYFFHLAWGGTIGEGRNDATLQAVNVQRSLAAVRLAKQLGCKVFVGVGSQAEYGRVSGVLTPELECHPENEYGKAKLRAGVQTRELAQELGLHHVWCRVLSTYGPYDGPNSLISYLLRTLLTGEAPQVTPGEQIWDYASSTDIAAAILGAAESRFGRDESKRETTVDRVAVGNDTDEVLKSDMTDSLLQSSHADIEMRSQTYVLGSGKTKSLRTYMELLREELILELRNRGDRRIVPEIQFGAKPYPEGQVMHLEADVSAMERDFGFCPKDSFEEGIRRTIRWYLDTYLE